jgi:hypothetical protein
MGCSILKKNCWASWAVADLRSVVVAQEPGDKLPQCKVQSSLLCALILFPNPKSTNPQLPKNKQLNNLTMPASTCAHRVRTGAANAVCVSAAVDLSVRIEPQSPAPTSFRWTPQNERPVTDAHNNNPGFSPSSPTRLEALHHQGMDIPEGLLGRGLNPSSAACQLRTQAQS